MALSALVVVAYRDGLDAWFAADDFLWLEIGNARDVLRSFTGSWGHGAAYRPLARLSLYLDLLLFGRDARFWHLHSLLLHALGAGLLGLLLQRLSGQRAFAVLAAVVFALLPLGHEAAIWISGRMYVLCLPLALLAALLFDRFLLAPTAGRIAAFAAILAVTFLTYEGSMYAVPALLLVALVRAAQGAPLRPIVAGLAATAALAAVYLVTRRALLGPGDFLPTREILSRQFLADVRGVAAAFVAQVEPARWPYACAALLAAWWAPRMVAVAGLGLLFAAAAYAPFSFVASFGARYLYAAGAGLAIAVAALLVGLSRVPWLGKPAAAVLLLLLLRGEWQGVREAASEWREAGAMSRRTLDGVARAIPRDPSPDVVVAFDVPLVFGRALGFVTYFDVAMRLFHPEVAPLALSDYSIALFDERRAFNSAPQVWRREASRRATSRLPALGCLAAYPQRSRTRAEFARALLACPTTAFVAVGPPLQEARLLGRDEAAKRFRRRGVIDAPDRRRARPPSAP